MSGSAIAEYEELFTHGSGGKPHVLYNRTKKADPPTFFYDARPLFFSEPLPPDFDEVLQRPRQA